MPILNWQTQSYKEQTIVIGNLVGGGITSYLLSPLIGQGMKVKNDVTGAPIANSNDILRMKSWNGSAIVDNWLKVNSRVDITHPDYTTYDVSRQNGTPGMFQAGVAVVNYGQSGQGYIYESSDDPNGPLIAIRTHGGQPWTGLVGGTGETELVRIGNLQNTFGLGSSPIYGFEAGQYGASSGKGWVIVESTNGVRLGKDDKTRISLSNSGILTINDSGGNAVFTFDGSLGAQFTKPLTLATTGGIYQGTGTFASPTTGIKMWAPTSSTAKIGGYNGGALQWYGDTDGKLYAGLGKVILDSSGVRIIQNSTSSSTINWDDGSGNTVLQTGATFATFNKTGYMSVYAPAGDSANWSLLLSSINNNTISESYMYLNSTGVIGMYGSVSVLANGLGSGGDLTSLSLSTGDVTMGSVRSSTPLGARVYSTAAAQSIANNTLTAIAFNAERWDTDTIHDNSTNNSRLTCRTAGKYVITGQCEFASNATGYRQVAIKLNGSTFIGAQSIPALNGVIHSVNVSATYDLVANDYVEMLVSQTSGGALNVDVQSNYSPEFSMIRIA